MQLSSAANARIDAFRNQPGGAEKLADLSQKLVDGDITAKDVAEQIGISPIEAVSMAMAQVESIANNSGVQAHLKATEKTSWSATEGAPQQAGGTLAVKGFAQAPVDQNQLRELVLGGGDQAALKSHIELDAAAKEVRSAASDVTFAIWQHLPRPSSVQPFVTAEQQPDRLQRAAANLAIGAANFFMGASDKAYQLTFDPSDAAAGLKDLAESIPELSPLVRELAAKNAGPSLSKALASPDLPDELREAIEGVQLALVKPELEQAMKASHDQAMRAIRSLR